MEDDGILTEEQRSFRKTVRYFAEREIAPYAAEADRSGNMPVGLLTRLGELGYLSVRYPETVGGVGGDFLSVCLLMEELYRVSAGIAAMVEIQVHLGTMPLFLAGTLDQVDQYLRPAIRGEKLAAFAMTEPDAGSDAASLTTRAQRVAGGWVLKGRKTYITNGSRADFAIVAARTGGPGARGVSLFVVDADRPGFGPARRLETLGLRASDTAEVILDDVKVDNSSLLGRENEGFGLLMQTLNEGRVLVGAESVGLASAALHAAIAHAKTRRQFGQEIGRFQAIRFRLADMATGLAAARLLVYTAAGHVDSGLCSPAEAAMAKLFASETASRITREALLVHGGSGYMMDLPVQRYLRDALVNEIVEGTSEIQREVIAKGLGL